MCHPDAPLTTTIVAVYPDHPSAEQALRHLHHEGFAIDDLSIVGREFETSEQPIGFISWGDYAAAGAKTGACFGWLFGLVVGAAFLVLPGVGPVVVAGPLAMSLVAAIEGAVAGTALGSLAGALIGWGVPKDRALKFETHVKGGKFLIVARGKPDAVTRARNLLAPHEPDDLEVYDPFAP